MKKRVGIVKPKRVDDLRPTAAVLVGKTLTFDYAGTGGDDEAYPGQMRWVPCQDHGDELGANIGWFPEQDIEFI